MTKRNPRPQSCFRRPLLIFLEDWSRRQKPTAGKGLHRYLLPDPSKPRHETSGSTWRTSLPTSPPRTARGVKFVDGPPTLSPSCYCPPATTDEDINDKIRAHLDTGVKLVWLVDPFLCTVTVCRPDAPPEMFNVQQKLTAEPYLPGFPRPGRRDLRLDPEADMPLPSVTSIRDFLWRLSST